MADTKISALTDGTAPQATDNFVVARGAGNNRLTWAELTTAVQTLIDAHVNDATDAHDASAISVLDTAANFTGTNVETVVAELQDNIDAAGGGITKVRLTGRYYNTIGESSGDATNIPILNEVNYSPFPVETAMTIDRLSLGVSAAGGAGSVVRLGIYSTNASGYPGSLVLDAGTLDGTSATYQELTISQALSANTLYWLACVWQVGTVGTLRANGTGNGSQWLSTNTSIADPRTCAYLEAGVTGALPATATPSTGNGDTQGPAARYRVA